MPSDCRRVGLLVPSLVGADSSSRFFFQSADAERQADLERDSERHNVAQPLITLLTHRLPPSLIQHRCKSHTSCYSIMAAIVRIAAAEHGLFNRIRQVVPICISPSNALLLGSTLEHLSARSP